MARLSSDRPSSGASVPEHMVATRRAREQDLPLVLLEASAEQIPLAERSVDSVVITYALCTIPEPSAAIAEFHRVLRPGGRLLLSEHGLAPDPGVRRWQHAMDRLWPHVSGGCHVNRDMAALLGQGGFDTGPLQRGYIPGPRPLSYNYWGALTRRG